MPNGITFSLPSIPLMPGYYKTKREITSNLFPNNKDETNYLGTTYDSSSIKPSPTWPYIYKVNTETNFTKVASYIIPQTGIKYMISSNHNLYQYTSSGSTRNWEFPAGVVGYIVSDGTDVSVEYIKENGDIKFMPWHHFGEDIDSLTDTLNLSNVRWAAMIDGVTTYYSGEFQPGNYSAANNDAYDGWSGVADSLAEKFNNVINEFTHLWYPEGSNLQSVEFKDWNDWGETQGGHYVLHKHHTSIGNKTASGIREIQARTQFAAKDAGIVDKQSNGSYKTNGDDITGGSTGTLKDIATNSGGNIYAHQLSWWKPATDDILRANHIFFWSYVMTTYLNSTSGGTKDAVSISYSDFFGWATDWKDYSFTNVSYFPFNGTCECGSDVFDHVVYTSCPMNFRLFVSGLSIEGIAKLRIYGRKWPDGKYRYYDFSHDRTKNLNIDKNKVLYFVWPETLNYTIRYWDGSDNYKAEHINRDWTNVTPDWQTTAMSAPALSGNIIPSIQHSEELPQQEQNDLSGTTWFEEANT